MSRQSLNWSTFFSEYNLPNDALEQTGLKRSDLEDIYEDHLSRSETLESAADYVAARLRQVGEVHSIKIRIKHPEHLVEKIIRKRLEKPKVVISPENYRQNITDLIGVRALHLFKEDWLRVHEFVAGTWKLHEKPIANVRKGDPEEYTKQFKEKGCRINEHKYGYRSVHYLLESTPAKELFITELQVRTIFEEGWSEIDHRIRYPYDLGNVLLSQLSAIHNRLAGSADEIGSFIQMLKKELKARDELIQRATEASDQAAAELKLYVEKLQLTNHQKQELEKRVKTLTSEAEKWNDPYSDIIKAMKGVQTSLFKPADFSRLFAPQFWTLSQGLSKTEAALKGTKESQGGGDPNAANISKQITSETNDYAGVKQDEKDIPSKKTDNIGKLNSRAKKGSAKRGKK